MFRADCEDGVQGIYAGRCGSIRALVGQNCLAAAENADERLPRRRQQAGEQSMRPDIQAGALRGAEGDEPQVHEHPSYRETAPERDDG